MGAHAVAADIRLALQQVRRRGGRRGAFLAIPVTQGCRRRNASTAAARALPPAPPCPCQRKQRGQNATYPDGPGAARCACPRALPAPARLADRVIDRRVEHDRPGPADPVALRPEQVAFDGQARLGLVADELPDDPLGPVFLDHSRLSLGRGPRTSPRNSRQSRISTARRACHASRVAIGRCSASKSRGAGDLALAGTSGGGVLHLVEPCRGVGGGHSRRSSRIRLGFWGSPALRPGSGLLEQDEAGGEAMDEVLTADGGRSRPWRRNRRSGSRRRRRGSRRRRGAARRRGVSRGRCR